jgi:hypothetical protein
MFGSSRRCSLILIAFIASPFGLQRRQSMTRQTVYRGPVFEMARRQFDGVADLLNLSFDERDRLLYPKRAMAVTCPIHRDEGGVAVFEGLSRSILYLADLRKLTARMAVPYRALSSSRTPEAVTLARPRIVCRDEVSLYRNAALVSYGSEAPIGERPLLARSGHSTKREVRKVSMCSPAPRS